MLHASALAVSWKAAFYALFQRNAVADASVTSGMDIPRLVVDRDDEREAFHLDDMEIAPRLVNTRGLHEYKTPPHAHLLFPSLPAR
jgi:hypothetical protein